MINNKAIAKYYDEVTPLYIKEYGCVYQGCVLSTETYLKDTLDFLLEKLNPKPGDIILDAGCGVGVVSMYFAAKVPDTTYYGVTISQKQADIANELIKSNKLENRVFIKQDDYHNLSYPNSFFDKIFFFESTSHSYDLNSLINQTANLLKNDGELLIKDLFLPKPRKSMVKKELKALKEVEEVFKLNLSTIKNMIKALTKNNFKNIKIEFLEYPKWYSNPLFDSMIANHSEFDFSRFHKPFLTKDINDFGKMSGLSELGLSQENIWATITTKYKNNDKI